MTKNAKKPLFRNKTKMPQIVYNEHFDTLNPITLQPGDMVRGEHFSKYAGKNGCLELVPETTEAE